MVDLLRDHYEASVLVPYDIGANIGSVYDWNLTTVPQLQLDGRTRLLPAGRVVGGGSVINGMIWNRGNQDDYNAWYVLSLLLYPLGRNLIRILTVYRYTGNHLAMRDGHGMIYCRIS